MHYLPIYFRYLTYRSHPYRQASQRAALRAEQVEAFDLGCGLDAYAATLPASFQRTSLRTCRADIARGYGNSSISGTSP